MKIKKSIHMRVIIGLEKGQKRIRCLESEFEDAAKFGIRDPFIKKGFDPDLAGNTSALLRYLIADFTAKSGK